MKLNSLLLLITIGNGLNPASTCSADNPQMHNLMVTVFGDAHVVESAMDIHKRARRMTPVERYEFLSRWVLPGEEHATLRLHMEFSPSYPAPNLNDNNPVDGRRLATGGEIVCPAIDLIEAAGEVGQLDRLRASLDRISPKGRVETKNVFAMQCLAALAANDTDRATMACEEVLKRVVKTDPYNVEHRSSEMLLLLKAAECPAMHEALSEYASVLFGEGRWPAFDHAWSRHIAKLAFKIIPVIPGNNASIANSQNGDSLRYWTPVTYPRAVGRGLGRPVAEWIYSKPQIMNTANHGDDMVYFNIPLLGDLTVEADVTVSGWREAEMMIGTKWVAPSYAENSYDVGTPRGVQAHNEIQRISHRERNWYRHRTHIVGQTATTSLDGRVMHHETFPATRDLWIAIRSRMLNEGGARNVKISGTPTIPGEIDLLASGLDAWIDYYAIDETRQDLPWDLTNAELTAAKRTEFAGTFFEQALFYHRPMLEDGTVEYEFFYQPDKTCTFPALDRMCFVLDDNGIGVHWLTDGRYSFGAAAPDNFTAVKESASPLPLNGNAWNKMLFKLRGDVVELVLNGQSIATQSVDATNQRFFGFFHYCDQQSLRVRNVRWKGDWPRELPSVEQLSSEMNDLAGAESEFLDQNSSHLKVTFQHNFVTQGLPPELFQVAAGVMGNDIKLTPAGLLTTCATTRVTSVALDSIVGGDFDIFARYTAFLSAEEGAGARLLTRLQSPKFDEVVGGRKHMIHRPDFQENVGFLWYKHIDRGQIKLSYDKGQNIEETAGTVRLSRRGDTIFILTAEVGSDNFRMHMKQQAGTEDLSTYGVQLQSEMPHASVTWTELQIRAERIQRRQQMIAELDRKRRDMKTLEDLDFSESPHNEAHSTGPGIQWVPEKGLRLQHTSASKDRAAFLMMSKQLPGDCDTSLDLKMETLRTAAAGESSLLAFQLEFQDAEHTRYQIVLFHDSAGTNRLVAHHQIAPVKTRIDETTEVQAVFVKTLTGLRIVRRGKTITLCATSPESGGEFVLAQVLQPESVSHLPARLNVFAHADQTNAEISVLLKRLRVANADSP